MNKGMDKHDTLFVKMKTLCKIVFFFFCVCLVVSEKMSQIKTIFN